jgi:hypothetical protein
MTLLIPAFSLLAAPPVLTVRLLRHQNAPLPYLPQASIPSFGQQLKPRYVLGASALDQ